MRARVLVAVAVISMAAVGCTVPSAGTPLPASSTQEPTAGPDGDLPTNGAPKVDNPLDASHFEQHPCDALEPDDAATLNLPAEGEQQEGTSLGEWCMWFNHDTHGSLSAYFFSGDDRGLSSVYQEAHASGWAYFERIDDIEGHPAVAYNLGRKKEEAKEGCVVAVGLTDQLVFTADVSLSDAKLGTADPCPLAAKAAGMMVRTMREAA